MARDVSDTTPIGSAGDLAAWLEAGCKPPEAFRLGTEHEKFPFRLSDLSPVPYEGAGGIGRLLDAVQERTGWEPILDAGRIIGLFDPNGGGAISLEPGGQFELSGAPLETVHATAAELAAHLELVNAAAEPMGIGFLGLGHTPVWTRAQVPVMPKSRYRIMAGYMPKVGTRGLDMMFRTSTVQVNLDFASEADMVEKLRVSLALQPLATALFAASPFVEGAPTGLLSNRSEIWRDTDKARSGMLPFVFEPGMGFERYVAYALDVPMYFVKRGDTYHDVTGASFRDLLAGRLAQMPGERATLSDWANHLSTIFPEVRLKRYLEMRGADASTPEMMAALPALFVGLLYDRGVLDEAWQLAKGFTAEQRQAMRDDVPRLGLGARAGRWPLAEIAREVLTLARKGLARRARLDAAGQDETVFLKPLEAIVDTGRTEAQRLLELYDGPWKRQVEPVFTSHRL